MDYYSYSAGRHIEAMEAGHSFRCDGPNGAVRILIFEDTVDHIRDAVAACESAGVSVSVSTNLQEAMDCFEGEEPGKMRPWAGIISDIYMPEMGFGNQSISPLVPGGVPVALAAEALGVPFVHCTSGYHHGDQYNWICDLGRQRGWPQMVDVPSEREGGSKDWPKAIQVLLGLIAQRNGAG
ncbi:MAG: hypothetical protein ABIT47_03310 [Candidatus Paceibacterota bacterium]